ncbi:Cubilin [Dufourea novaeangliae]|uniref:Cubilin n=1 Tax=Dufourea novaeangliae TaxID=178035 RepID=A0A154PQG1_DUFNO|nr:Cubilin [Dufourea novaeangliae]
MATGSRWLLLIYLGFCAAWMDERPVLESRDGSLFISAAKDRNITLKILGDGYVNVNEINLLHVASAAQNATRLIERWRTGYLAEVETGLQRLTQIVEGPDGLERRMAAMFRGFGEANSTFRVPGSRNQDILIIAPSAVGVGLKVRALSNHVRRLEEKVRTIETKLRTNECSSKPCQNGGMCQDLYEGYQCNCPSNWEGPNCMVDVNECVRLLGTDLGCQNGATCINLPGSYRCNCASGWHGLHCTTKMSVCSTQNSDELCGHGVCVSKPGSLLGYTCICDQGWQADGTNPACIKDVDECAGNHRPCSVNPWVACRNAPGTFFCDACPRGYTGNGYYCSDIDECLVDNGGCSTSEEPKDPLRMILQMCGPCPTGYRGDGVTCVYVGGCAVNNGGCHPFAKCVQNSALTSAYVICRCPAGYAGNGVGPNGCHQITTDVSVQTACSSNPCVYGRCVSTDEETYTCICYSRYSGRNCDVLNPCMPNPCKNNGVCVNLNGTANCDCPSTFTGNTCETPRQTCGGVSRNAVGHLQFPGDGNVYQHGLSCAWVLVTNSSLVLNVTFTKFNIEHSTDCKYDFLQIHDGRNAGSQMIGRFCGNTLPHENGNIVSSHNSLYFWFHSDSSISHDGFAFHWNSTSPICGGTLTDNYGTVSSPGSPGRYPPNRDCYWQIAVEPSKRIQFHFGQLMLEEHPTCENDYLEIVGEDHERLGLYCNHTRPAPLIVPGNEAVLHFHSDSAGQDAGFQIHYSIIEGIPGCSGVYTAPSGTISTPIDMSTYHQNMECDWRIQLPAGERVQITWSKFELEDSNSCQFDFVEIYDGPSSDSQILGRFCGSTIPPLIKSNSNVLLIIFKSDWSLQKEGFTLSYNTLCGGEFTEESGVLHSPMYPNSYHSSRTCIYEIVQPPGKRIVLNILDMDIEGLTPPDCYFDYLEIFDGDNENSTKLATLCGSEEYTPTEPYYSTHNYMYLKFTSDGNVQGRGFSANYTTIATKCGGLLKTNTGTIQSPGDGSGYENNEDCTWTIQAPPGYVVQLIWLSFDLEYHSRCIHDYITVYDMDLMGTFCGSKHPPIMMSQGNTMTVMFHSDSTLARDGFVATYLFIDASKVCGGHFIKLNGMIKSPGYPERYPNRRECVWVVEAPNRQRVILNVQNFELEYHSSCVFDHLEIRNGGYETSPLIGKYCGTDIPTQIISQTNQLYLKFVSDSSRQYPGFSIEWDSTTRGCGGTMSAASGDIVSPNYPQSYMHHADCYWKIAVAAGSLIRLLIVDLDLEHHEKCRFDYIEIYEGLDLNNKQRYCGNPYPKVIQAKSNMMTVRFRSDFTNSGHGFHLKYETLCQNTLHGFYGVIESPNFPDKYEQHLNCSWIIDAPRGNKVNMTFSHFDIDRPEADGPCRDFLDVKEGQDNIPNTQLAALCNSNDTLPQKIHSAQHQVFVKYMSDSQPVPIRFRLEWLVDGCGGHLTKPSDSFTSPGYPSSYPTNVDCEWLIEVDYMHSIELTIHDIHTEKQKGCFFDKLQIYSGESDKGLKLVEICYSEKPVVYTSFGNKMFLLFHSDISYAARGFNISYKSVPILCGGKFTADAGFIHSTNYPQNYPPKQNCEWLLQVNPNYLVNVTFLDFDLEASVNCTDDYVQIYDGATRNSPLMATLCRNTLPPSFISSANEMLIVMKSDSIVSAKGFQAMYTTACGARMIVKDQGYLTPTWTHNNIIDDLVENCTWTLIAEDPEDHVTLIFTHMEISLELIHGLSVDCTSSYIEVHEGQSVDGPSLGKYCDNVVPLPITSTGNALTVHLYALYNFLGHFAITYSVLNSACGGTYTSYHGKIASPDYPNSYPLNSECIYILNNSPGNKLRLTFTEFDIQSSENCDLDYLEIRENDGIGKLIGVYCGTSIEPIRSSTKLWIKFKSDGDGVAKGFVAEYTFEGGNELTGPTGRITSPLYPLPFKSQDTVTWRISVKFQQVIRIEIKDMFIENSGSGCYSYLRIYDGYNNEAPILLEACTLEPTQPMTTTSNVAYIELATVVVQSGSWFDLVWLEIPRDTEGVDTAGKVANCTEIVSLTTTKSFDFTSPGWPNGYGDNLQCTWVFTSPPGTHLVLRVLVLDLEETNGCVADALSIYNGDALSAPENAKLLERLCLSNSSLVQVNADNVMTVKFESDGYVNKTGFSAYAYQDCGGKLGGPNGEIKVDPSAVTRGMRVWQITCEWNVEVKPGRTIEVTVTSMPTGAELSCTDNYVLLKNGDGSTSSLLGDGKYCPNSTPPTLMTTGNRLYVKLFAARIKLHFKLSYREVGMDCGGEYELKGTELDISTPNYPNIPPPYTECTWKIMAPNRERISIHFVDRFDLSNYPNCEREYVEIRDGLTDNSKLLGRFCKDVAPSTMSSAGNMMYIHFYTDIPEPKNGFKASLTVGEVCGGIIRGTTGLIVSPNYPFFYKKNQTCEWWIIAPVDHTLKLEFRDIDLPMGFTCEATDHVVIGEKFPENETNTNIGLYCGDEKPGIIETSTNQAVIQFKSDNFEYHNYRGFSLNFTSSQGICGGELTAMSGIIKSNGYPNVATRARYCDWRIKLPLGFQVVVDIIDLDIASGAGRIGYMLSFYNDFKFKSRIKVLNQNDTTQQIRSSSNTMMIGYSSSVGYRGFKLRYSAAAPAPCGGVVKAVKGDLTAPIVQPFNASSYYCVWRMEAPDSLVNNGNNNGLTLTIMVTGFVGGVRGYVYTRFCYNFQYISLADIGMICGNFSEPMYLRSPKLSNEVIALNGTFGKPMHYDIQYEWQPCGGILQGESHVIRKPNNISYPINCVWSADYPDTGELIKLSFTRLNIGACEESYISVRNGGPLSPEISKFCGNIKPYNITSTSNRLWIEYFAKAEPNDFEFIVEPANNGCGGALRGKSRQISSPNFPKEYPNNAECTWEITADNGYHVGLAFVDRFNLEGGDNCKNDYIQIFDWVNGTNGRNWRDQGKVCGRNTPPPFNSTSNRMKVTFHSNEKIQGDGFRALWHENCGGIFEATTKTSIIKSPSYPNFYKPNLFCNYTVVSPGNEIVVEFMEFQLERSRRDCRFDNVTIVWDDRYGREENIYCGDTKPPTLKSSDKVEILFRTDSYIERNGFVFKYFIKSCGGTMTAPGEISPLMRNEEYFGSLSCTWTIHAPSDKSVVLRFERFILEHSYRCSYDSVEIYNGPEMDSENKLVRLCGNLTNELPVFKSTNNSMVVYFTSDINRQFGGFSAKVLFVKSIQAGCGGTVNLTSTTTLPFRTQKDSTYESLEDCQWNVIASPGKNIKFTFNSIDVRNATNKTSSGDKCTGDYLEIRDGANPLSQLLGKYCGNQLPAPVLSSSNSLWIRFFSDGTVEGTGVSGTLEAIDGLCGVATLMVNETKHVLVSPHYPNSYGAGVKCRWLLRWTLENAERTRIQFLDFDLANTPRCDTDYIEITDPTNRKYIDDGFGENFIWGGSDRYSEYMDTHSPTTSYKYCGKTLPHDYFSYSNEVEVRFQGNTPGHRGFKLEFVNAVCDRNYTRQQGRIIHEGIKDCWVTITAPVNHTISLYFNRFMLYDPDQCTKSSIQAIPIRILCSLVQIYEGNFGDKLLATYCGVDLPSPIFSTGNKLSLHSWSEWHSIYEYYDITYTTTDEGRGCGGRLYNYAGSFTSPMFPNEYRNNSVCAWDVSVPRGLKVVLQFVVFDIGSSNVCENKANSLKIYDVSMNGELILANTYCGGDDPAPFEANRDRVVVSYTSTVNNIGTGWSMTFKGRA